MIRTIPNVFSTIFSIFTSCRIHNEPYQVILIRRTSQLQVGEGYIEFNLSIVVPIYDGLLNLDTKPGLMFGMFRACFAESLINLS